AVALIIAILGVECGSFSGNDPSAAEGGVDAAGPDSADALPGTDAPLCSAPHALCDDFNRTGSPLDSSRWSRELGDGGVLAVPAFATSPALLVSVGPTGAQRYFVEKTIGGGAFQSLHCSFRLYLVD